MAPTGSETKFRVAICGAGIGGLIAAAALSRFSDIEVEIFEAAEKLTEVGAGIGIFPRTWEIIKKLGLEKQLLQLTDLQPTDGPVKAFTYRKSDRQDGIGFYTLVTQGRLMTFHRADFQKVLLARLPPSYRIHCSKRLRSYTQQQGGPISLLFEDGTGVKCDVLLGADGLKSAVRRSFLREKVQWAQGEGKWSEAADLTAVIEPCWSGTNAYRALIPGYKLRARYPNHRVLTQPTQYLGKNAYIIAYPITKGKFVNFVAFKAQHDMEGTKFNGPWVCQTDRLECTGMFRNWEPEVQALLDCVERPLRWAIHVVKPLPSMVSGNVALLGDAAHASLPHQGSGAGQAIEDAYILALLLGHPLVEKRTIHQVLHVYDHIRRPFASKVQERARLNGLYFTFNCPEIDFDKVLEQDLLSKLGLLGQIVAKNWEWAWSTSIEGSVRDAMNMLEESLRT